MPMPQAKMKPLTEEEKEIKILQILQQKREQFSLTILNGLCSNPYGINKTIVANEKGTHSEIRNADLLVNKAVEMADLLLEKLWRNYIPSRRRKASDLHRH